MAASNLAHARLSRIQPLLFLMSCCSPFQWLNAHEDRLQQQGSHEETVEYKAPLLAFVPCLNATDIECDPLIYPAILQAVEDINTNTIVDIHGNEEILQARLMLSIIETKNDPFDALISFFGEDYQTNRNVAGIVGPGSNAVTELMAYVVGASTQTVMVSYGASDIVFSTRKDVYSRLFHTIPSEEAINRARICLMKKLEWRRIAMATSSSDDYYAKAAENLAYLAKSMEMDVNLYYVEGLAIHTLEQQDSILDTNPKLPGAGSSDVNFVFGDWIKQEYKIVVILLLPLETRSILCKTKRLNNYLLEESHVWILPQYFSDLWWELDTDVISALPRTKNCSNKEILTIMNHLNIIVIDSIKYNIPELNPRREFTEQFYVLKTYPSNLLQKVLKKAQKLNPSSANLEYFVENSLAAAAYDSVWALALAYNNIMKRNRSILPEDINIEIEELSFRGTAKDHSFGSNQAQDFSSAFLASQFLEETLQPVFLINNINDGNFDFCSNVNFTVNADIQLPWSNKGMNSSFNWHGGKQPSDGLSIYITFIPISGFVIALILDLLAFSVCITMLLVMAKFWTNKHIKSMSPKLVLVAMLSCTTIIPSNIIFGLAVSVWKYNLDEGLQSFLCIVLSLVSFDGVMISFTIFLAKSWRIYKIFHNSKQRTKIAGISNYHLGIIIGSLLVPYFLVSLIKCSAFPDVSVNLNDKFNSSTQLNWSYCESSHIGKLLDLLRQTEFGVVTFVLVFLSYKNSTINDLRYREEGQSVSRFGMTSIIIFLIIIALFNIRLLGIVELFWFYTVTNTVTPVIMFNVVFLPKYLIIYRESRNKRMIAIKVENTNQLAIRHSSLQAECIQLKKSLKEKDEKIETLKSCQFKN